MLFDQRTRAALRDAGLTQDDISDVEQRVTEQAREDARRVETFFDGLDTVFSDMDQTHSVADYPEHDLEYVDLFTHSEDIRGFVRFETWGAYVEGARVLEREASASEGTSGVPESGAIGGSEGQRSSGGAASTESAHPLVVELSLGPTVDDRVRFAAERSLLE